MHGAVPEAYFVPNSSIPAADVSVHILDYLYKKLDEVCLVHGGEVVINLMAHFSFMFPVTHSCPSMQFKFINYANFRRKVTECYFICF